MTVATPLIDPACFGVIDVAYELVQVVPSVVLQRELVAERCAVMDFVEPLLVQRLNIDVGSDGVPLRLRVREPRRARTFNTWVVDAVAPLSEWTVNEEEATDKQSWQGVSSRFVWIESNRTSRAQLVNAYHDPVMIQVRQGLARYVSTSTRPARARSINLVICNSSSPWA